MVSGRHVQRGSRRRVSYRALYERVGARLYITAAVRYGDRTLAMPDLEEVHRADAASEESAVVAALERYIDASTFDFGAVAEQVATPGPAADSPVSSARSEWAQVRSSDWGQ